jgi:large subunit ribosomal protein L29
MATDKNKDLQKMTVDAIQAELQQANDALGRMRFDHGAKGLQNPLDLKVAKKEIARYLTELRSRELAGMSAEEKAGRSKIRARRK